MKYYFKAIFAYLKEVLFMIDKLKVINFLQDFGCAKLEHLQILFDSKNNNFRNILSSNMVSKKGDIFVHNTRRIDENMLVALDILCKYKLKNSLSKYQFGYDPVSISFLTKDDLLYHIIVANEENKKGIVKKVNSYPLSISKADRIILAFPDRGELQNIECDIPFLYCTYPDYKVINTN
jgi:hypothetical protein